MARLLNLDQAPGANTPEQPGWASPSSGRRAPAAFGSVDLARWRRRAWERRLTLALFSGTRRYSTSLFPIYFSGSSIPIQVDN